MKRLLVVSTLVAATQVVAAPEYRQLPIEQREAAPASVEYPQSIQTSPQQQQPAPNYQPQQPAVPSNVQWELYNQIQQMQQEIADLRGMVEQQAHQISQLKDQQRQRYLDLDHRLNQIKSEQTSSGPVSSLQPATQANDASGSFNDKATYDRAIGLMRERKFKEAIALLDQLLEKAPKSEYVPNAQYWLGELHMATTPPDYDLAKRHLIILLKDHKGHQKVADALYKLGTLYNQQGEKAKARVTLEKVISDYPDRQAAKLAKQLLTDL